MRFQLSRRKKSDMKKDKSFEEKSAFLKGYEAE